MTTVIKVENLGKKYLIGHEKQESYNTLRDSLSHSARSLARRLRHPLQANTETTELEEFWALKDISFDIQQGDRVGIIGRNGAGKSTLLKILSRITSPTTGKVTINGRVASLLEVGTGFHPELSGRENIFLNGAILGMRKTEIKSKFDEIVAFAEVEKFLDTPVKRYSSGMYVRLAFAVAAHLEPEILIVDEVLAVGDMQFQKKCLGKMEEIGNAGKTVLFVSHNLSAIKKLCEKGIFLNKGIVECTGDIDNAVINYLSTSYEEEKYKNCVNQDLIGKCKAHGFSIENIEIAKTKNNKIIIQSGSDIKIKINYSYKGNNPSPALIFSIKDSYGIEIVRLSNQPICGINLNLLKNGTIELYLPKLPLVKGVYYIDVGYAHEKVETFFYIEGLIKFEVEGADVYDSGFELDRSRGIIWLEHKWIHY